MDITMQKVIAFGAGGLFRVFSPFIESKYHLTAISDNDTKQHGKKIDGVEIIPPADIILQGFDLVIVTSMYTCTEP